MSTTRCSRLFTGLCWLQGLYYFATGLWPLISITSFEMVTGKKTDNLPTGLQIDHWLVFTVSVLILSIAIPLLVAAYRKSQPFELCVMAVCAAAALTGIDIVYTARGVIRPIYLLDAAIEVPLIVAWSFVIVRMDHCVRNGVGGIG